MEPSNRTPRSWRFLRKNPRAAEDDNAQEALIEAIPAEAYPSSPPQQPGEAYPSSPPQQARPDCLELEPEVAYPQPDCQELEPQVAYPEADCQELEPQVAYPQADCVVAYPQPDCLELEPAGAYPQPDCLELDRAGASPQPDCVELDPAGASPSSTRQQAQPDCFELALAGAPFPSSPPSVALRPPPVCVDQSRLGLLSLFDRDGELPSAADSSGGELRFSRHGADNKDDEGKSGEGAVVRQHSSNDDSDDDEDPFLTDRFGNLTTWRLSEMEAAFEKHLQDEASKPKVEEKKYSKGEILKQNADRKKHFMEYALQKYNSEEDLAGEMRFVFDEIKEEVYVVEEGMKFYEHFNFTTKQAGSTVLFFAEVVPHGDTCDVLCCKPLDCNDNGHCFGCKNQGSVSLRHPADEALYVGGHEDCEFPFMWDSITDSEDDSD